MTLFYPDISHHDWDRGWRIPAGTIAVCIKATEGYTFIDPAYANQRARAVEIGAYSFAYHWLHEGNEIAQAKFCHSVVGNMPLMIDVEHSSDNPRVANVLRFVNAFRAEGGITHLAYVPRWYWQERMDSESLKPLEDNELYVVSSNYPAIGYTNNGPGWSPYGGIMPRIWQYSDGPPDMNAFRGTLDELIALVEGDGMTQEEHDMLQQLFTNANNIWLATGKNLGEVLTTLYKRTA